MSDEMELDQDEIDSMQEDDPDELTPEDIFSMTMINKYKKTKVRVELQDNEGDIVELPEVVAELVAYVKEKHKEEGGNAFQDQIMPLMSQAVVSGLGRMMGTQATAFILSSDLTRTATIDMMCVAFLLLKFVQQKDLVIHTYEEEVSDEEIESIERKARVSNITTMGSLMGMNPKEILRKMVKHGQISKEEVKEMNWDEEPEEEEDDGKLN